MTQKVRGLVIAAAVAAAALSGCGGGADSECVSGLVPIFEKTGDTSAQATARAEEQCELSEDLERLPDDKL